MRMVDGFTMAAPAHDAGGALHEPFCWRWCASRGSGRRGTCAARQAANARWHPYCCRPATARCAAPGSSSRDPPHPAGLRGSRAVRHVPTIPPQPQRGGGL